MEDRTISIILAALLAVSEALAYIPWLKASSVLQLIIGVLRYLASKKI